MYEKKIQESLPFVEMPGRYLGNEINTVKKDLDSVDLKFALLFPDLYEIGTSYFGGQILYHILNRENHIAAERVFTPAPDMARLMKKKKIPLFTLESRRAVLSFDIVGISLLYELNFTNILWMLDLAGIPFFSNERDIRFPLIVGGGPCAYNPEGIADFFDVIVVGDGEKTVPAIAQKYIQWHREGDGKKKSLLNILSEIEGVYIPSFFKPIFDSAGLQGIRPLKQDCKSVRRSFMERLDTDTFPDAPVVPFGKPVHDRLRLEIARGCSKGCRFCQAGMIYRPVRERTCDSLTQIAEKSLINTGYRDISMLSLSTGDYSCLSHLMCRLSSLNPDHMTSLSLPSVRADRLTPEMMGIIQKVRKTGFTIAPEAGSQKLRNAINKNLSENEIYRTVETAFQSGWRHIKLYFMIGLPFETDSDVEAICELSRKLANIKSKHNHHINVSVATFIPKPHTPFQRCAQISPAVAEEKLKYLKDNLRHPGIKLKWQDPRMSFIEGIWARGDRRLSALLAASYENGCIMDGWTDMFRFDLWEKSFEKAGIDPYFYTTRERKTDEPLPWDHINSGVSARFLAKEYEKSRKGELTPDCRNSECEGCGVCDFSDVKPVIGGCERREEMPWTGTGNPPAHLHQNNYIQMKVFYSKLGQAKYFGHLEFAKIIRRALRRCGIKVKYSKGFNPAMKISFDNPLPVGVESEEESFTLHVDNSQDPLQMTAKLNNTLPSGITIIKTAAFPGQMKKASLEQSVYRIVLNDHVMEKERIDSFMQLSEWVSESTNAKGKKRKTDLRKAIHKIELLDFDTVEMVINNQEQRTVRPSEVLLNCFEMPQEVLKASKIIKIKQEHDHA